MKIVQSLWTKPLFEGAKITNPYRISGGWPSKKYNYMSWAFSCLQFRKFYDQVELITDKKGKELLIDRLNLPYTAVHVVMDVLNKYPPGLWALGKIYAYSIQDEPFLHVDGDVFIWEKFNPEFEKAHLIAQHIDEDFSYYYRAMDQIEKNFTFIPTYIVKEKKRSKVIRAYSTGILGGSNISFIKLYTKEAFRFIDKNIDQLKNVSNELFILIYEQYLFYCLAKEKKMDVKCHLNKPTRELLGLSEWGKNLIHPLGNNKINEHVVKQLVNSLLQDYPEYYYKIIPLLSMSEL